MRNIKLGSIIREVVEKTTVNNQYPVLTSSQNGLVTQDEYFNKQIASQNNIGYKVIKKGQFTYRAMSDTGRFYINQSPHEIGIVSPAYPVFEIISSDDISSEYIAMYFKSEVFQNVIALQSTGSTRVSLKLNKVKDLELVIPNIEKQRDILNHIHKMDSLINARREQLAKLDELVKSRFIELFGNILCDSDLPLVQLKELADIGSSKRIYANEYVESGVPFYRSKEIRELGTGLKPSVELFIKQERYDEIKAKYGVPKKGDILIAAIGATIGYSWIVDTDKPFYYKDGNLIILSTKNNVNPIFLNHTMGILIEDFKSKGVAGSAQLALTIEKLEKMMVINPNIELQNQFATFVEQTDKSKLAIQQSLEKLETLKKALMQKYFG